MDYNLPGRGGIKAAEIIRSRWPATAMIALTDSEDGVRAERIVKAGAKGCILRNVGLDTLLAAIRTVISGGVFYSQHIHYKLGTKTPLQLVQAGLRLGLVPGAD